MTYDYLIGIDPGVHTGIAIWNGEKFTQVTAMTIVEAAETVRDFNNRFNIKVYFEDARQRHWFGNSGREKLMGAGSVRRDSQIWETICHICNIPYQAVAPKNNTTKLTADRFARYTGWKQRTNEHARDAAMLVFKRPMTERIDYGKQ